MHSWTPQSITALVVAVTSLISVLRVGHTSRKAHAENKARLDAIEAKQ